MWNSKLSITGKKRKEKRPKCRKIAFGVLGKKSRREEKEGFKIEGETQEA